MHPLIVRKILYPLHESLQGRETFAFLQEMERTQWLSAEALQAYQWDKLKKLVTHAARSVPYYQKRFEQANLDPNDFSLQDFQRLPAMDKELFKANEADIISRDYRDRLIRLRTGSSTGSPLWFYSCKHTQAFQNAAKLRCRRWWGIEPGDLMFEFWASPIELSKSDWVHLAKDRYLMNYHMLSALGMTDSVMADYVHLMNRKKPRVIVGYPSALHLLAQHIRQHSASRLRFTPKALVATAETLLPHQRQLIAEVFGAPLVNEYGARDGGLLAYECPDGNLHVVAENVFLEIDPLTADESHPSRGDVLVTNLDSFAYPFIRYRLGDQVTLTDRTCSCGRGLPLLERIEGRQTDWLTDRTGKKIHGLVVAHTVAKLQGLRQFQMIQTQPDELVVKIVKNRFCEEHIDTWIVNSLKPYFAAPMNIRVLEVDNIEASTSGKHRFIINKTGL